MKTHLNPKSKKKKSVKKSKRVPIDYIFRRCITLRNGVRLCKPAGQAFKIPIYE